MAQGVVSSVQDRVYITNTGDIYMILLAMQGESKLKERLPRMMNTIRYTCTSFRELEVL